MALIQYFQGVVYEFRHVRWLKFYTVVKLTFVVLIVALIIGMFLAALDLGFEVLLDEFSNFFKN